MVLIAVLWNVIRLWSSLALAGALNRYAPWPGAAYIGVTGAAFVGLGALVLWGFWRRRAWAPRALLGASLGYAAWSWLDRWIFQSRWMFAWQFSALITGLLLAYIAAVALDPRNRLYFGKEAHDRQRQDRSAS